MGNLVVPEDLFVNTFILNGGQNFQNINIHISILVKISNCHISFDLCPDKRIWNYCDLRDLSLKGDYDFKGSPEAGLDQWGQIWAKQIPPFKYFLVWRLFQDKLATDEQF